MRLKKRVKAMIILMQTSTTTIAQPNQQIASPAPLVVQPSLPVAVRQMAVDLVDPSSEEIVEIHRLVVIKEEAQKQLEEAESRTREMTEGMRYYEDLGVPPPQSDAPALVLDERGRLVLALVAPILFIACL